MLFTGKKDFGDVITLGILRWADDPGLSGRPNVTIGSLQEVEEGKRRESGEDMSIDICIFVCVCVREREQKEIERSLKIP